MLCYAFHFSATNITATTSTNAIAPTTSAAAATKTITADSAVIDLHSSLKLRIPLCQPCFAIAPHGRDDKM